MPDTHKKGLNADLVSNDLEHCCRGIGLCDQCQGDACIIGYAKQCIADYRQKPKKEVPEGAEHVPTMDFKTFDEVELETAIAHILRECKDCKADHTENCIINVIRNCYEVGLLGDTLPFEGSALQYLIYLNEHYPEKSAHIAALYKEIGQQ